MVDGTTSTTQLASLSLSRKNIYSSTQREGKREKICQSLLLAFDPSLLLLSRPSADYLSMHSIPNRSMYIDYVCACEEKFSERLSCIGKALENRKRREREREKKNALLVYARFSFLYSFRSNAQLNSDTQWETDRSRGVSPICHSSSSSWKMNSAVKTSLGILCLLSLAFTAEQNRQGNFAELCQVRASPANPFVTEDESFSRLFNVISRRKSVLKIPHVMIVIKWIYRSVFIVVRERKVIKSPFLKHYSRHRYPSNSSR